MPEAAQERWGRSPRPQKCQQGCDCHVCKLLLYRTPASTSRVVLSSWLISEIISQLIVNEPHQRSTLLLGGLYGAVTRVSSSLKKGYHLLRKLTPCLRHPTPHRSPKSSRQWPVPTTCGAGHSRMHLPGLAVLSPPPWQSCARRPPDGAGQPELWSRRSRCPSSCRDDPGGFPYKRARQLEGANYDDLSGG